LPTIPYIVPSLSAVTSTQFSGNVHFPNDFFVDSPCVVAVLALVSRGLAGAAEFACVSELLFCAMQMIRCLCYCAMHRGSVSLCRRDRARKAAICKDIE
jgi:hypothetical protein